MRLSRASIRTRIVLMTLVPLVCVTLLFSLEIHHRARKVAEDLFDNSLLTIATTISENVVANGGDLIGADLVSVFEAITRDRVYYRISGPGGTYIAGHASRPSLPEAFRAPTGPLFTDAVFRGEDVRLVAFSFDVSDTRASGKVIVHVWQTVQERRAFLVDILGAVMVRSLLLLSLVGVIIWLGVRLGLRPLQDIGTAIERRGVNDLRPIERDVPTEIAGLVGSMNRLFDRLETSVRAMEAFIANASHQLRTPLAAIRTKVELARETDDADEISGYLDKLAVTTARTSRLAEQLLNLARVESSEMATERFDASEIARDVTAEAVKIAISKGIDIGFEGEDTPLNIVGDPVLLREALRNLVANALAYCPSQASVTVSVMDAEAYAVITVVDDGPGVSSQYRARLGERFFRVPGNETTGCGLGLTIAGEAAARLGGTMKVGAGPSGRGLSVQLRLPKPDQLALGINSDVAAH